MKNKRLSNIITIIVCVAICIGILVIKVLDKDDQVKEQQVNKQVEVSGDQEQVTDVVENENIPESDLSDDALYDDTANDNYIEQGDTDITVFLKNGEVLYNNDQIPLSYFDNLMLRIQKFCDLNYPNVVKEIEIDADSVSVKEKEVIFKANLMNGHYLTVSYDIDKKQFTMSDTIK